MDNLAGSHIKGYQLLERIGAGGFGAVYKAHQSTVGREVAMKIILPHYASHPDFIRRFETEAQVIARLEHLHIVPLYDYWRDPDGAYLIMRWLKGGSLKDALGKGRFEIEATGIVLDQIASALSLAHRNNVIHRDLKPANIFMDEDGNAYLGDFGIAKDIGAAQGITEVDVIVGSPDYLAPEQARSEQVTPRTDIYSLGVVLYELLTGEHPFPNQNAVHVLFKHLNEPLPEITNLPDDIADKINEIIQKATAKNPLHRYADALELASAFQQVTKRSSTSQIRLVEILTRREQEILQLVMAGKSNKEIAAQLYVTITTVKWYVRQIFTKLGVRSRVQAIVRARELQLITANGGDAAAIPAIPTDEFFPENPYKGLLAFQAADSQDFFGREKLIEKLVRRLSESGDFARFLAVVGPSGSGKSSLVKAGLIPAIWQGALPQSEKWFVAEMLPGAHPFDELEVVLTRIAANQSGNLREQLSRDERGLLRASQLILPDDGSELLLVIDQFEELFTLVQDETIRVQFLKLLQTTVIDPRSRVRIVVTLRADYYDRPLHYPDFGEMLRSRMETVLPLSVNELERAISLPAERVDVHFEAGLVASIIEEIHYQAGALPLLQYALTELFEQRQGRMLTLEAYETVGRSTGALAKRADELYLHLDETGREVIRQMFLRLVTLGEGAEDTRRRVARSELLALVTDAETMDDIIDTYGEYRLLAFDHDPATREPTVEVAHEAILREWERLRQWLNESRDDIRQQRQVAQAAEQWQYNQHDTSYLLSGSRLEQAEKWHETTQLVLTPLERKFMDASVVARTAQQQAESERQAREVHLEQRSRTFLRGLVAVLLVAMLVAFGLTVVAINQSRIAQSERDNALASFQRAEAQRLAAEAQSLSLQNGNSEVVALLAIRSINTLYTAAGDEMLVNALSLDYPIQTFIGHTDRIKAVDFSPDGRYALTGSGDSTVRLWDIQTGTEIRQFSGDIQDVNTAAFSPDGRHILTGSRHDHTVRLWDVATGEELWRFNEGNAGAFSLGGTRIFAYSDATTASFMIDTESREILHTISEPQVVRRPEIMAYSPDGTMYVNMPENERGIHVLRTSDDEEVFSIPYPVARSGFVFSNDGRYLLVYTGDNYSILVFDIQTAALLHTLIGHTDEIHSVDFSSDGNYIVSGALDRTVRVWDAATGEEIRRFSGHNQAVRKVAFSPDSRLVLSGSFDYRALLWQVFPPEDIPRLIVNNDGVSAVSYSNDGELIVDAKLDGSVTIWNAATHEMNQQIQTDDSEIWFADFTADGNWLLTGGLTQPRVWDVQSGELVRELDFGAYRSVSLTSQNQYVLSMNNATEDWTGGVILWDVTTGLEVRRYTTPYAPDVAIISPNSADLLVYASADATLRLFDIQTGEQKHSWNIINRASGSYVAFSPDSSTFFAGSGDGIGWLWDVQTGEQLREFVGHRDQIYSVAFSHDGEQFVTTSPDRTIRVWEVATGREIRRITVPFTPLNIEFSPQDDQLLILGNDERIHLLNAVVADTVLNLCTRLHRDFTPNEREQYDIYDDAPTCP